MQLSPRTCILSVLAVSVPSCVAEPAVAQVSGSRCVVPRGWSVVVRNAQAVIIVKSGVETVGSGRGSSALVTRWRYCLLRAGAFRSLVVARPNSQTPYFAGGPPSGVETFALSGATVSW